MIRRAALALLLASPLAHAAPQWRSDGELEYYAPTKPGRAIQSLFVNLAAGAQLLRRVLVLEAGLTLTEAWGTIEQRGALLSTDGAVFGVGPLVMLRCEPLHLGRFALSLDVVGALVVYTQHFPPGGDVYNFTWRLGGELIVRLTARLSLAAGARWMHVSNAQGLTPHNPSYEGLGFPVALQYRF